MAISNEPEIPKDSEIWTLLTKGMMRHDSFKERVNHLENDHRESGQSGGLPMVLEPGTATLYPVPEIQG